MSPELEKLQGTWRIVDLEIDGGAMSTENAKIVISENNFTTIAMGAEYEGIIEVDPAANPPAFDLHFTTGPEKGNTSRGIYSLSEDNWKICLTYLNADRPREFSTAPGSGLALETLKRETVGSEDASYEDLEGDEPETASGEPVTELDGEWTMVRCNLDGEELDNSFARTGKRIVRGNQVKVMFGAQVFTSATFSIDRLSAPKEVDHLLIGGKTQYGIYDVDGDLLKTCFSAPGTARPDDFAPGKGRTVALWRGPTLPRSGA